MKKQLNTESITNELAGASAYFPRQAPPPGEPPMNPDASAQQPLPSQPAPVSDAPQVLPEKQATQQPTKPTTKQTSNIASNITILQLLDEADIAILREPAYQAQTFRLTEHEIEWMK